MQESDFELSNQWETLSCDLTIVGLPLRLPADFITEGTREILPEPTPTLQKYDEGWGWGAPVMLGPHTKFLDFSNFLPLLTTRTLRLRDVDAQKGPTPWP